MGDAWATLEAVAADRQSGAAELATRAARALDRLPAARLVEALELVLRGHPSMAPLWHLAAGVLEADDAATAAQGVVDLVAADGPAAAAAIATSLPDRLVTISYSSTVLEAIRIRRPEVVWCLRSLPGGEGERMATLAGSVVDARVVADADAPGVLSSVGAVLTGADAVTPRSVVNKLGTSALVRSARDRRLPAFAVAGTTKLLPGNPPLEPLLEAIPLHLFTRIGLPGGPVSAESAGELASGVDLGPALRRLLHRLNR